MICRKSFFSREAYQKNVDPGFSRKTLSWSAPRLAESHPRNRQASEGSRLLGCDPNFLGLLISRRNPGRIGSVDQIRRTPDTFVCAAQHSVHEESQHYLSLSARFWLISSSVIKIRSFATRSLVEPAPQGWRAPLVAFPKSGSAIRRLGIIWE